MVQSRDHIEDIVIIPEATEHSLNQRQLADYRDHRVQLIKWLCHLGKDPEKAEGYAYDTARQRAYKIDQFYRWLWNHEDGYTVHATTVHADAYTKELVYEDHSETYKAGIQKAVKTLFKYLNHEKGRDINWEPEIKFTNGGSQTHQVRDFLTEDERRKIKQAVLEHGSIPHYNSVEPRERDQWKAYLAQRFEKPKEKVTKNDWDRANGWKYTSIVYASMDAGFRPKEVGRAKVSWLDLENNLFRIPKEESTKNHENWHVAISDRTANILRKWLSERDNYEKYRDSDVLWLTRYSNPYGSEALNRLLQKLCEKTGIPTKHRVRRCMGSLPKRRSQRGIGRPDCRSRSGHRTGRVSRVPGFRRGLRR